MLFYTILNKLFLIELIAWGATFGTYVFLISSKKDSKEELKRYMKKVLRLYIILLLLISILVIMLPYNLNFEMVKLCILMEMPLMRYILEYLYLYS